MEYPYPPSTAVIARRPFYALLAQFPVVCFTLTLLTDIAYWRTSNLLWLHFSEWLLFAGLVFGALAVLVGIVEFFLGARALRPSWAYVLGSAIVLLLAIVNSLVHAGDGWTAIMPWGLVLSAATVIVMIVTDWLGRARGYRYGVVVADDD